MERNTKKEYEWSKQKYTRILGDIDKELGEELKEKLKSENKVRTHNERGAGRKSIFTEQEKESIRMYRLQGKTIKELAEMFSCSVGIIHKLIHE